MKDVDQEKVRREIKLAMMMKVKEKAQAKAMGASSTSGSGFGNFKKEDKQEEWSLCIDKAHIMRKPLAYKRRYVGQGEGCLPIYSKYAHAKRVELERKYFGKKDDVLEHVNVAKQVMQSLGIAITRQGQILLNGEMSSPEAVSAAVKLAVAANPEVQALISADGEAHHADVVKAIDIVKSAGIIRFALQVEKP